MSEDLESPAESKEPILAPEEIEALMEAVVPSEEADALFATLPDIPQPKHVEPYSFESSGENGPERFPLFLTLQRRATEELKEQWGETFQRDVILDGGSILQRLYEDIIGDDKVNPQVYFIYDVQGFGRMIVAFDLPLVVAYIDAMLGGHGETFEEGSIDLSPVEMKLALRIGKTLEKILAKMWAPVHEMQYIMHKVEVEAQFLGAASLSDMCFSVPFNIELSEALKGAVHFHYPRSFLEPVLDSLRTAASDDANIVDAVWDQDLEKSLSNVPLTARLEFGQCHLNIKQFLNLRPGDFLPLSKSEHDSATLWLGRTPMFEAMPGSQDGVLAAEILSPLARD